jgi:gluconate 2-dehydrogenase gamma chain
MKKLSPSRRDFLQVAASVLGGAWLSTHTTAVLAAAETAHQAMSGSAAMVNLSADEASTLVALVDQIFPPDEAPDKSSRLSPGASELGAVHFIDAALGSFMAGAAVVIKQGLADLNQRAATAHSAAFPELPFEQQTALVQEIESSPFFGRVHFLTLCGLFALPAYGGNINNSAWKMIGFEARHVWQAPFGYYDAQHAQEQNHASS